MWTQTKTINRYTNKPNQIFFSGPYHCLVYRRQYGWAFTVRAMMVTNQWVQISTSHQQYPEEEIAKLAAIAALEDLKEMTYEVLDEKVVSENHPHS